MKVGDKPNFSFHHNIMFANCFIRLLFLYPLLPAFALEKKKKKTKKTKQKHGINKSRIDSSEANSGSQLVIILF